MKIIKRDGREVPFDRGKICRAIDAANADMPEAAGCRVQPFRLLPQTLSASVMCWAARFMWRKSRT